MKSLLVALSVTVLVLAGCGGGGGTTDGRTTQQFGRVSVTLSDPPTCGPPSGPFSHVYVTVRSVMVHTSSSAGTGDGGWTEVAPDLATNPRQIDLLSTPDTRCVLASLGAAQLPVGRYQQIRLILLDNNSGGRVTGNQCQGNDANCVVLAADGSKHTLKLSSEANTGLKIPSGQISGGGFTIEADTTSDLNIDFDACASIVVDGSGEYRLKPVLHAGEVSVATNSISGRAVESGTGASIAGGAIVVALEQRDSTGVARVVMQKLADAGGNFTLCPVPAGTYDVVIAAIDGSGAAYAATITTGVQPGNALGNVPLVKQTGASTAPATLTGRVTTSTGAVGSSADLLLAALQTVGTTQYIIPLAQQSAAVASLATAPGAVCPANTNCVDYSLAVPAMNPNVGAFASGGTTYSQDTVTAPSYIVDALGFVVGSGGTANCSPSEMKTAAVAVTPGTSTAAPDLAFTGCTP